MSCHVMSCYRCDGNTLYGDTSLLKLDLGAEEGEMQWVQVNMVTW